MAYSTYYINTPGVVEPLYSSSTEMNRRMPLSLWDSTEKNRKLAAVPVQPVVAQAQVEQVVAQAQVVAPAEEHQALVNLGEGLRKVGTVHFLNRNRWSPTSL